MEFETLKRGKFLFQKWVLVGVSGIVFVLLVIGTYISFAKYLVIKNIPIASGTINYRIPDFELVAMYQQKANQTCTTDTCYSEITTMPDKGYTINESKSYCTLDNVNKDTKAKLFTNEDGKHVISGLSKSSKCYLYFDKQKTSGETILGNVTVNAGTPDFSKTSCAEGTNNGSNCEEANSGVYKAVDESGKNSYYFRGSVTNNYVKFANKWWRIIRINGDGSIRLIYNGTSAHNNGTATTDSIAITEQAFNISYNNNAYVGFQYISGEVHGLSTKSNVLTQLETWYTSNLTNYANKIDTNAGFCGDRTPSTSATTSNNTGGTGTTLTYYGAYIRLVNSTKSPVLTCPNASDLYTTSSSTKGSKSLTYPIGLISADEVAMAGGVWGQDNYGYYLYNGQVYYSLSPCYFGGSDAYVFGVYTTGYLNNWYVDSTVGVRPVINLKAAVTLTGKGTASDPYVVI